MHPLSSARPRRLLAAVAGTALLLCLAPLGAAAAAGAAPLVTGAAASAAPHVAKTPRHLKGVRGHLTYDVTVPVFSGTKASARIEQGVLASARATIAATAKPMGGGTAHHTLDGRGRVTTNDGRTVQVVLEYDDFFDGAAHPTDTVQTVAVRAATGSPVTLGAVFRSERKALPVLAWEVKRLAAKAHEPITEPGGLAPHASNWAAWQSTAEGFQVHFQDYQLGGHGARTYTVPWSVVEPLLTSKAAALLAPRATAPTPSSGTASPTVTSTPAPAAPAPSPTATPTASPTAAPTPSAPTPTATATTSTYYADCDAVRAAGQAPLNRGQPGYRSGLDRDGDGVACET